MQTIINLLGKMPDVHKCLNVVDVCAQSNISICCLGNRFCCLFSFFFFSPWIMHHLRKVSFITTSVLTRWKRCNAMTSSYEGQPERLEFPSNIPCLRNCKHRLASSPGGTQQIFIRGGSIYHFPRKRCPFRRPSIDKWYPFHIPCLELFILFNCCKCTVV